MLSLGIRFGEGFDKNTFLKFIQKNKMEYEFDFLVVGTNSGGLTVAKEASDAGKKVAIINWKTFTPAEEGDDGDNELDKFAKKGAAKWSKKIRTDNIDIRNRIINLGMNARKLMRNAVFLYESVNDAKNSYWNVENTSELSINWMGMTDHIIDYVMSENWKVRNDLSNNSIELIEGAPVFKDDHTVAVFQRDGNGREIQAEEICIALEGTFYVPEDIPGGLEYGVTCDDLIRFKEPPGRTLIVGSGPAALECAGIIASLRYSVTVVCRSAVLKGYDRGMAQMMMTDMADRGVTFTEKATLKWIKKNKTETRLLTRISLEPSNGVSEAGDAPNEIIIDEEYDTVLFAIDTKVVTDNLNLEAAGIKTEPQNKKILVHNGQTEVHHIYAVGDVVVGHRRNSAMTELSGKLLGKRLFYCEETQVDYDIIPHVVFTPIEYAFIGLSEAGALWRFGDEYIDVYYESFKPLEHTLPPKNLHCHIKVIVLRPSDRVIGLHFFGPDAAEIIQGFAIAMKCGLSLKSLQTSIGITTTKAYEIMKVKEKKLVVVDNESAVVDHE